MNILENKYNNTNNIFYKISIFPFLKLNQIVKKSKFLKEPNNKFFNNNFIIIKIKYIYYSLNYYYLIFLNFILDVFLFHIFNFIKLTYKYYIDLNKKKKEETKLNNEIKNIDNMIKEMDKFTKSLNSNQNLLFKLKKYN